MLRSRTLGPLPIIAALATLAGAVGAAAPVRVVAIEVTGNVEVTAQTVIEAIKGVLRVGQDVPDLQAALEAAHGALMARGYFDEVAISADAQEGGQGVRIAVRERPTVKDVVFVGNTLLTDEELRAIVRTAPGLVVNPGVAQNDSSRIQSAYLQRGAFATVTHADASEDGVVTFVIQEAHLEGIEFDGLHVVRFEEALATCGLREGALFSESETAAAIQALRRPGWFSQVLPRPREGEQDPADVIMVFEVTERPGVFPERVGRPKPQIDPSRLRAAVSGPEVRVATEVLWPLDPAVLDAEPDVPTALETLRRKAAEALRSGASSADAMDVLRYADLLRAVGKKQDAAAHYRDAVELCRLLLEMGAGDRLTHATLGRSLGALGNLTEAIATCEQALQTAGDTWENHAALAAVVLAAMQAGVRGEEEGLSCPSGHAMAELMPLEQTRSSLLESLGALDEVDPWRALARTAREHAQVAWELAPGAPEVARLRCGTAVAALFHGLREAQTPRAVLQLAAEEALSASAGLVTAADYDPYVDACLVLLRHPAAAATMAHRPEVFAHEGGWQIEAFRRDLAALASRWPAIMRAYGAALGWARLGLEQAEAREDFEAALAGNPYDEAAYIGLLQIAGTAGDWAQAAAEVERRLATVSSARDLTILAGIYLRMGRPEAEVIAVFDRIVTAHPDSPLGYAGRAGSLLRSGASVDQVRAAMAPGLALAPEDAYAACLQCVAHLLDAKPATAARALKSALTANPQSSLANRLRAEFFDVNP
jgi:tetratricopeptide (TPR) repeat protein